MSTLKNSSERPKKLRRGLSNDFDAVDLRIFLNIAESTQLQDLASKLGITKSAISMRIAKLEKAFEVTLIQHNPLRLTQAGEIFRDYALADSEARRKLHLDMAGLKHDGGSLRIIAVPTVLMDDARHALSETRKEFIHLEATLFDGMSKEIIEAVAFGHADIGLVGQIEKQPHLIVEKYRTTEAVLVTHQNHPLSALTNLTLKDVEPYRIIALPEQNLLWKRLYAAQMMTNVFLRHSIRAPDMETAAAFAVSEDMPPAIVLEDTGTRFAKHYGAKVIYFTEPWRFFDLFTVTTEIERRSEPMTYFITQLRKRYRETSAT